MALCSTPLRFLHTVCTRLWAAVTGDRKSSNTWRRSPNLSLMYSWGSVFHSSSS
ncbi:unnamed protein product [Ixodes persulcatus]